MLKFCLRIRYSSRSSGPSKASRKTSSASGGMYRSCGSANSGSPYRRATRDAVDRRSGGVAASATAGSALRTAASPLRAASAQRCLASGRRRAAAAPAPRSYSASASRSSACPTAARGRPLLVLERRLLRLQLVDEGGDVGLVGLPEQGMAADGAKRRESKRAGAVTASGRRGSGDDPAQVLAVAQEPCGSPVIQRAISSRLAVPTSNAGN